MDCGWIGRQYWARGQYDPIRQLRLGTAGCRPRIVATSRTSPCLLPPDLQECWFRTGSPALTTSASVVDALDLTSGSMRRTMGDGRRNAPYEPFAHDGQGADLWPTRRARSSSRAVASEAPRRMCAFRALLAAAQLPDNIARRAGSSDADIWGSSASSFAQCACRVAREMGLASVRHGKLPGRRALLRYERTFRCEQAPPSCDDRYERMGQEEVRLQAQIEALLRKAGAVDAEEDEHLGRGFPAGATNCHRSCNAGRSAWPAIQGRQSAFGGGRNARPMMSTGPSSGQGPQSPGRAALQARLRRARAEGAEQFHPLMLQPESQIIEDPSPAAQGFQQSYNAPPDGGRWGAPDHRARLRWAHSASDQGQLVGLLDGINETFRGRTSCARGTCRRCGAIATPAGSAGAGEPRHRRARRAGA